jgi:hypothetical protein
MRGLCVPTKQIPNPLRLTNYSLAICLSVLLVNTVLFCNAQEGCEHIPGRSKLGSTPKMAIMNTELTFLTLMTAHAPLSLVLQQHKGAQISDIRLTLSFVMPLLVAICFTFDTKRYPETHQFTAYVIMGTLLALAFNSYLFIVGGIIAAILVLRIKCNLQKRKPKEVRTQQQWSITKFLFGNLVSLFFGLGVFLPMLLIMYRNEYYASIP